PLDPTQVTGEMGQNDILLGEADAQKAKDEIGIAQDALDIAIRDVRGGADLRLDSGTSDDAETDIEGEVPAVASRSCSNSNVERTAWKKASGFLCMESHDGIKQSQHPNAHTFALL